MKKLWKVSKVFSMVCIIGERKLFLAQSSPFLGGARSLSILRRLNWGNGFLAENANFAVPKRGENLSSHTCIQISCHFSMHIDYVGKKYGSFWPLNFLFAQGFFTRQKIHYQFVCFSTNRRNLQKINSNRKWFYFWEYSIKKGTQVHQLWIFLRPIVIGWRQRIDDSVHVKMII